MPISDHDYVNFSQDHELNYVLTHVGKRQTEANRFTLRVMGTELKGVLRKTMVTHKEFFEYVKTQLRRLE
jgi:hypothetical protein